jgi:hypothetical protein
MFLLDKVSHRLVGDLAFSNSIPSAPPWLPVLAKPWTLSRWNGDRAGIESSGECFPNRY